MKLDLIYFKFYRLKPNISGCISLRLPVGLLDELQYGDGSSLGLGTPAQNTTLTQQLSKNAMDSSCGRHMFNV